MKLLMKITLIALSVALNVFCVIVIVDWVNTLDNLKEAMSNLEDFSSSHVARDMRMVAFGSSYGLAANANTNNPTFFLSSISGKKRLIVACCSSREAINTECANAVKYIVRYGEYSVNWRWAKGEGCFDFAVCDENGNVWMDKKGDLTWVLPEEARNIDGGEDVLDDSMAYEGCPSL